MKSQPAATSVLRPVATREQARPSAPKSIDFPIDNFPAELIHMICAYLKPTELANLRLVSRLVAPISLQYMIPEVHLILAKDSFEQLTALAEHPLASKYVTSFFFEADKLGMFPRTTWERLVASPQYLAQGEELRIRDHPCNHPTERSLRTFLREVNKFHASPRHQYTEELMDHAYGKYNDLTHFQHDLQEAAVQEKKVGEAMKKFPLLKELTLSTRCCTRSRTSGLRKEFEPAFCTYYEFDYPLNTKLEPLGLQQMRSLLLGAYHAGLKVEVLHCGAVSWRILLQDTETLARMRNSVSNVKDLRLEFATSLMDDDESVEACYSYLKGGRLKDFITAAPNLEHLDIGFHIYSRPTWPTHLKHIVGSHHWPTLKTVKFKSIGTSEDDLVSFCSLHASTLKCLHLTSIGLVEGNWFSAFTRMRKILTLDAMVLWGRLGSLDEGLDLEMDTEEVCPGLKKRIEAYFLGPCASDELSLDEFLERMS
ncbi:MAG: hypothetical protein Q9175_005326 [Cornicularia normoerica]